MDKIMYSLNNEKLLNITQSNTTPKSPPRMRRGFRGGGNYSVKIFFSLTVSTNIFCRLI